MIAAGHSALKIDLMKPTLHEETFIRSVEYITTIIIIFIMPKSSSSTSFPHIHRMSRTDAVRHPIFHFIMMILSYAHLYWKFHNSGAQLVPLALKSLSEGRLQLFLIFLSSSWLPKADEACKHSLDKVIWHTDVLQCSTDIVQCCCSLLLTGLRTFKSTCCLYLFYEYLPQEWSIIQFRVLTQIVCTSLK